MRWNREIGSVLSNGVLQLTKACEEPRPHASLATSFVLLTSQLTFRLKPIIPVATIFATAPLVDLVRTVSYGFLRDLSDRRQWMRQQMLAVFGADLPSSASSRRLHKMRVVALRNAAKN